MRLLHLMQGVQVTIKYFFKFIQEFFNFFICWKIGIGGVHFHSWIYKCYYRFINVPFITLQTMIKLIRKVFLWSPSSLEVFKTNIWLFCCVYLLRLHSLQGEVGWSTVPFPFLKLFLILLFYQLLQKEVWLVGRNVCCRLELVAKLQIAVVGVELKHSDSWM